MKVNTLLLLIFAVLLGVSTATAQPGRKIALSGTEYFDPLGLVGPNVGAFLASGTIHCPGSEPTLNPLQPCLDGSRTHARGAQWKSRFISSTPGLSDGWFTVEANFNWDAEFTGPAWGTFSLAYDSGGTMDGIWEGVRYKDGASWIIPLHVNGQITGGPFDGGKFVGTDEIVEYTPMGLFYTGTILGNVIIPHKK